MTHEEVVNILCGQTGGVTPQDEYNHAVGIAIDAMRKMIPAKVIGRAPFKSFGFCPDCYAAINTRTARNYCSNCGQSVNWKE